MMSALRAKLADVSQRQADLLARYNSRHPAVVNVEAEKRDIERSIAAETQRTAQTVRSEYTLAKARESALEQAVREATGQGGLDSEAAIRLRELERTAAVNKTLFEDFLQKAKISDERSTFQARDARIVLPAQPGGKSFPNNQQVWMTALLFGLALGIGGAFLIEMLNHGFTTPRQVEDLLKLPVLASIQQMDDGERTKGKRTLALPHYQIEHPLSAFSEAMRTLRSGIHMLDVDRPPKLIHITSTRPGEGKTTIALSLAISAALSGLKVVLVDADLRHPSVSRFFNLEQEKGLVDLLTGSSVNELSMFHTDGVAIIPAGSKTMNPSDILSSERMKLLVNHLKENFDYVVMDSPPVGPVIDPIILSDLADKSIFVVQWASTPRDLVESCVKKISAHKRVGGIVLNLVKQNRAKKYGSEYQLRRPLLLKILFWRIPRGCALGRAWSVRRPLFHASWRWVRVHRIANSAPPSGCESDLKHVRHRRHLSPTARLQEQWIETNSFACATIWPRAVRMVAENGTRPMAASVSGIGGSRSSICRRAAPNRCKRRTAGWSLPSTVRFITTARCGRNSRRRATHFGAIRIPKSCCTFMPS